MGGVVDGAQPYPEKTGYGSCCDGNLFPGVVAADAATPSAQTASIDICENVFFSHFFNKASGFRTTAPRDVAANPRVNAMI